MISRRRTAGIYAQPLSQSRQSDPAGCRERSSHKEADCRAVWLPIGVNQI